MKTKVRNDLFDSRIGYVRGRSLALFIVWQFAKWAFFRTVLPWPSTSKVLILRLFGAKIGRGVCIKPQVNIHLPWKLTAGDYVWLGEEVFILNFEPVTIGSHACVSQRAFLCAGNHNFRDVTMPYRNEPIDVGEGAWVGAQAFIAPGVSVGREAIVTAGSVLLQDAEPCFIYAGNPAKQIGKRWRSEL